GERLQSLVPYRHISLNILRPNRTELTVRTIDRPAPGAKLSIRLHEPMRIAADGPFHRALETKETVVVEPTERIDFDAEIDVEVSGETETLSADQVLVAVGFRPNTGGLGLEAAGVATDERGWIPVDGQCRTNQTHVYAIGDVTGPPLLAHRASYMAEVAAEVICGKPAAIDAVAMPSGVFTAPEIASAGLSEAEAIDRGYEVRTGLFPTAALGRAAASNATGGVVKVVIDAKSDIILGVGITAANACDLIAEACLALEMGALAEDLSLTVHVHPTLSEGLMEAAKAARGEPLHIIQRERPRRSA
ncbi:MAG: FAD-dependent oxidoreductase, partial [Myxococcota bacterium]|nr:FAD-dependent oxidoreductase [Myxococcota bacterium]